jgi:Ni,Fe-hydrogenase I cytochrome b subunit
MTSTLNLSRESRRIAGLLLLSIIAVESGGYYLTRVASGREDLTDFQVAFSRAGHAHAGVLITLALIIVVLADVAGLRGPVGYVGRLGVPAAAILMPTGFFLSSAGTGATEPNGWIVLLWLGGVCLAVGVVTVGVALLRGSVGGPAGPHATEDSADAATQRG